jgi:hypothetical protein
LELLSVVTCVVHAVAEFPLTMIEPGCQNDGTVRVCAAMSLPP